MAMVKFWRGSTLPTTRDNDTLYFDKSGKIYLGSTLIADVTVLDEDQVNSLVAGALANYRTSTNQDVIDNEIKASIKAISEDYLKAADKTELEGKITAHETAVNTKFNDYSTTAEITETLKGYQTVIPENTYDTYGAAAIAETNAKAYTDEMKASILGEGLTEAFDTLKEVEDWINGAGVNATELTTAIAAETKAREDADTEINETIADVKATAEAAYVKPTAGIAKTDLANDVQASLGKADTALQASDISGKADKVTGATTGNFAGLDANGNLVDSGKKADDFASSTENGAKELAQSVKDTVDNATTGLAAAHTKAQQGIDNAANALSVANSKATLVEVKTAIQGNTEVTVEACVKAINELNSGVTNQTASIGTIEGNVKDIITMLTWIEG